MGGASRLERSSGIGCCASPFGTASLPCILQLLLDLLQVRRLSCGETTSEMGPVNKIFASKSTSRAR
jgi:hypothetical protein